MYNKLKPILFLMFALIFSSSVEMLTQKITLENYYREKFEILINRILQKDQFLVNVDISLSDGTVATGSQQLKDAQKLERKTSTPTIEEKKQQEDEASVVSKEEDFFDLFGNDVVEEKQETDAEKVETNNDVVVSEQDSDESLDFSDEMQIDDLKVSIYLDPSATIKQTQIKEILCESLYITSLNSCDQCSCISFNVLDSGMGNSSTNITQQDDIETSENVLKEYEILIEQMRDDREREEAERISKETKNLEKELKSIENLYEDLRTQNRQEDSTKLAFFERKDRVLQRKRDSLLIVLEDKTEQTRLAYYQQGQDFQEKQFQVMMEMMKMKGGNGETGGAGGAGGAGGNAGMDYAPRPPYQNNNSTSWMWIIIILILVCGFVGMFFAIKQKPKPVYLKPKDKQKSNGNDGESDKEIVEKKQIEDPTKQASSTINENTDVVRSEVKSLRQSAVSMSVGQKEAATKIIEDWLDEPEENNQDESEKEG